MIQYPKQVHVTLPSVESWGTNMNIQKDPPKALWTRKIDKVSETQEITRMIGEDSGDRICEIIKVYPRGINPMVAVSYSNYGMNGGQNRQTTNAGIFGQNKVCCDGRSPYIGQAKLPYRLLDNGAFRPPVLRQEDLMPLSRLPRTNTSAWTQPTFINYLEKASCPKPEKLRQIQHPVKTSVRPTATITIGRPLVEPFELRQVIDNPIHTSVTSGIRSMDRTQKKNSKISGILKPTLDGAIITNLHAPSMGCSQVLDLNPTNYISEVNYSQFMTNPGKALVQLLDPEQEIVSLPVKEKQIHYSASSKFNRPNAQPLQEQKLEPLIRTIPRHQSFTQKSSNIYVKNTEGKSKELMRKIPIATLDVNPGSLGYGNDRYANNSRTKKIKHKLRPRDGFVGKATVPVIYRENSNLFSSDPNKIRIQNQINLTGGQR